MLNRLWSFFKISRCSDYYQFAFTFPFSYYMCALCTVFSLINKCWSLPKYVPSYKKGQVLENGPTNQTLAFLATVWWRKGNNKNMATKEVLMCSKESYTNQISDEELKESSLKCDKKIHDLFTHFCTYLFHRSCIIVNCIHRASPKSPETCLWIQFNSYRLLKVSMRKFRKAKDLSFSCEEKYLCSGPLWRISLILVLIVYEPIL